MKTVQLDEDSLHELMYEPQLARDLKDVGMKIVRGRSEATGEISRSTVAVWRNEDGTFEVEVSLFYPKAVTRYVASNGIDYAFRRGIHESNFGKSIDTMGYKLCAMQTASLTIRLVDKVDDIPQALLRLRHGIVKLEQLLAPAATRAMEDAKQRANRDLNSQELGRTHRVVSEILARMALSYVLWTKMLIPIAGTPRTIPNFLILFSIALLGQFGIGALLRITGLTALLRQLEIKFFQWFNHILQAAL